jgi:glycine C-acetyltransferase
VLARARIIPAVVTAAARSKSTQACDSIHRGGDGGGIADRCLEELRSIRAAGTYKEERVIKSPQSTSIRVAPSDYVNNDTGSEKEVLNFCANNYLGLSSHPRLIDAAHKALDERGFGLSSVRFICGTQDRHKECERTIAHFLGMDDCILYPSCFDANAGIFEALLGPEDAVISDALNHASLIDGIRLCKAQRHRYKHSDMRDLERILEETYSVARNRLIVTDGVFSMVSSVPQKYEQNIFYLQSTMIFSQNILLL